MNVIRSIDGLVVWRPTDIVFKGKVACFDIDDTITGVPKNHTHPKDLINGKQNFKFSQHVHDNPMLGLPNYDFEILPGRISVLKKYVDKGYMIVLMTNQNIARKQQFRINRVNAIVNVLHSYLGDNLVAMAAIKEDRFRKPNPGMWQALNSIIGDKEITNIFYCGDAAGRPTDYLSKNKDEDGNKIPARSDKEFAENVGITFYTPEMIFKPKYPTVSDAKNNHMVILVGAPGSGKTTTYHDVYEPAGYHHVSSDKFKSNKDRIVAHIKKTAKTGINMVIDATNNTRQGRNEYRDSAPGYTFEVVRFARNGSGWNRIRDKPVPPEAYYNYFKKLDIPGPDENTTVV
jgi:DNA 3'-phosphatase